MAFRHQQESAIPNSPHRLSPSANITLMTSSNFSPRETSCWVVIQRERLLHLKWRSNCAPRGREVSLLVVLDGELFNTGAEIKSRDPFDWLEPVWNLPRWITGVMKEGYSFQTLCRKVINKAIATPKVIMAKMRGEVVALELTAENFVSINLNHCSPRARGVHQCAFCDTSRLYPPEVFWPGLGLRSETTGARASASGGSRMAQRRAGVGNYLCQRHSHDHYAPARRICGCKTSCGAHRGNRVCILSYCVQAWWYRSAFWSRADRAACNE
jgi:hypothetical protein